MDNVNFIIQLKTKRRNLFKSSRLAHEEGKCNLTISAFLLFSGTLLN